jgi:LysM repeat protein
MTKGFVYLIEETDGATGQLTGYYKIGKTTNLDSRIRAFRTASKNGLEYRKTIEVDDYSEAETAVHKACSNFRMPGENGGKEWFDFRGYDIGRIESLLNIIQSQHPAYAQAEPEYDEPVTYYRPSSSSYSESFFSISGCAQYLVGLVLLLGVVALAQGEGNYEVMAGDTLSKLEREHGLPSGELRRQNPGINPDELKPGQKLRLPTPHDAPKQEPRPVPKQPHVSVGEGFQAAVFNSPFTGQTEVRRLLHGTPLQISGSSPGGWLETQHGWIHASHVAIPKP